MQLLDWTGSTPAENLALDEALLDAAEADGGPEALRFWEPRQTFVVLGYGKKAEEEIFLDVCRADGIPVLRRASGGGTVLQHPGCLNYALVLDMQKRIELKNLVEANRIVMTRLAEALRPLAPPVAVRGITDLAIGERKVMGSAQRRKRRFLLFHGCVLVNPHPELLSRYLRFPAERPEYRGNRSHEDFVAGFPAPGDPIRRALAVAWDARVSSATTSPPPAFRDRIQSLIQEKYTQPNWNLKY